MDTAQRCALCLAHDRLDGARIALHVLLKILEHSYPRLLLMDIERGGVELAAQLLRLFGAGAHYHGVAVYRI